jgi:hypothetical protein
MRRRLWYTKEKIYDLLPSIYRIRDKEEGEPLKALLEIIGEQVEIIEEDIQRLYNNWFIETCDEWLVSYIGDLLNTKILNPVTRSTFSHRSWVANTISYRRRKGTLATIERLSRDVTGWNCRAVEFFQNLVTTQYLNHLRVENITATVDLRNKDKDILELIGTPFDRTTHTVDVRHIDTKRGYYNIPNIGIFLWRLQAYPLINVPAFSLGNGKYTFSQLGYDLPIYNHPETETNIDHISTEVNIPSRIRRAVLEKSLQNYKRSEGTYFTYQNSIKIVKSSKVNGEVLVSQILPQDIVICNLSNWHHRPSEKKVAIDPELGRIIFPKSEEIIDVHVTYYYGFSSEIGGGFYERKEPDRAVLILTEEQKDLYHYKISKKKVDTSSFGTLSDALQEWKTEEFHNSRDATFEIIDSEFYDESNDIPLEIEIPENITLVIKSENYQRPVFRLKKPITVKGGNGSSIVFDGILFTFIENDKKEYDNNNIILKILKGDLSELVINHCTFVPGRIEQDSIGRLLFSWEKIPGNPEDVFRLKNYLFNLLNEEWVLGNEVVLKKEELENKNRIIVSSSSSETDTSIILELTHPSLETVSIKKRTKEDGQESQTIYQLPMERFDDNSSNVYSSRYSLGIFGDNIEDNNNQNNRNLKIFINRSIMGRIDSSISPGTTLKIVDSIVDGKGVIEAIRCSTANIENTTVFGKVSSVILDANNSIFNDILDIDRRQQGCIRFCYITSGSQIPRSYRCVLEEYEANRGVGTGNSDWMSDSLPSRKNAILERRRIRPQFTSLNYGDDGYGQLHRDVEKIIFEGGDNGSEIGAFNHLYNSQRIKNISSSLDEYLEFGLEVGVFLVT